MKLKALSAVVAAAVAGQAFALAPSVTPDVTIKVSGATAVDNQFESYVTQLCDASTLDSYFQPSDDARAYFCTVRANSAAGNTKDKNVLFLKNSGGSSKGVAPVANKTDVVFLDYKKCVPGTATGGTYQCTDSDNVKLLAEIGVSDVEPELFTIASNGAKSFPVNNLEVNTVNAQTFGVVVSEGLRNALQSAQGLTVGSELVKDMPSLSSDIIANIFKGSVASWNTLVGPNGGIATAAGQNNDQVNVCVRKPGSGTQAQFNAFYMKDACAYRGASSKSYVGFITAKDTDGFFGGDTVEATKVNGYGPVFDFDEIAGFESGCGPNGAILTSADYPFTEAQLTCLADNGVEALPAPWIQGAKGSSDMGKCITQLSKQNYWAIGLQSVEKVKEKRNDRNAFRYLAVDGIAPTLENVQAGLYKNWAAASIQWEKSVVTPGSDKEKFAKAFVAQAQSIAAVKTFNGKLAGSTAAPQFYTSAGVAANTGSLAFVNAVNSLNGTFDAANPVMPFNKGLVGPSSCASSVVNGTVDVSKTGR